MSDSNMNANTTIDESQRPSMPEEDRREVAVRERMRERAKCVPDILCRILGEATKDHVDTPSEKIVKLVKERDILFDMINNKKEDLEKERDKAHSGFLGEYIAALVAAKDVITRRITVLLSQT